MDDNRIIETSEDNQKIETGEDNREIEAGANDYPKKSYRLILLILACLIAVIPLSIWLNSHGLLSDNGAVRFIFGAYAGFLMFTAWYIYKKDRIYWITTYSYQDACNMSREERNKIGLKMWKGFGLCYGIYLLYLLFGSILGTSMGLDVGLFIGAVILSCILS